MRRAAVALARRVHLITCEESAQQWCEKYLEASDTADVSASGAAIALDCEGVRLGRFGRICLMQMQDHNGRVLLCDALRPGVIKALGPLLQSKRVTKVIHDCREDSAALYHQHGIQLQGIFDTQVAHAQLELLAGRPAYQASATELLLTYLGVESEAPDLKSLMLQDANLWSRRPLTNTLVAYAIQNVVHLLNLRLRLLEECDRRAEAEAASLKKDIAEASTRAVSYCLLNSEFPTAESMAKIGTRLWALMASRCPEKLVLKLNAGRVGLVTTPSAMQRFQDVELGDMVFCCISGVSIDGRFLYLDRYDHDWDFFDHQLRPSNTPEVGVYGREHRFSTSLFSSDVDPLLLRGLPGLASEDKAAGSNAWDVSPEDLGDPFED